MSPTVEEFDRHIAILEEFERTYGEFLVERRSPDHNWSGEEWARRERALKELAPQAEAAMLAAGAKRWDEGPVKINLPRRILRFVDSGDGVDDEPQWVILEELPIHVGALKGKRSNAKPATPVPKQPPEPRPGRRRSWMHEPNPWVLGIGCGIAVAALVALAGLLL